MAVRGSTFTNQIFAAADHGAVFAQAVSDGILNASTAVTVSGKVVTLPSGLYVVGGRVIEFTTAQAITIAATSGYARLRLQINLGGASTPTQFTVVNIFTDTATTITGFTPLVQNQINLTGVIYEIEMAVVLCGASHTLQRQIQQAYVNRRVISVSVPTTAWSGTSGTVTVPGLPANANPLVTYDPASYSAWINAGVRATATAYQNISLACDITPTVALTMLVYL